MRDEDIERLVKAILRATEEHGQPNTFSPGELANYYGGPRPMLIGRMLRNHMYDVWQRLGGSAGWGSSPRYEDGRLAV